MPINTLPPFGKGKAYWTWKAQQNRKKRQRQNFDVILEAVSSTLAEDQVTVAPTELVSIVVVDGGFGTNVITLEGADAASFEVVNRVLYLKAGVTLDFETQTEYEVDVVVNNTAQPGNEARQSFTLSVTDVNEGATVELANTVTSVAENTATPLKVADIVVDDDALGTNTLTLSGADAASFEIVNGTELQFKSSVSLNYEVKTSYAVRVNVDDASVGGSPEDFVDLTVSVTNVNEGPTITSSSTFSVAENETAIATLTATDPDAGTSFTWSKTGSGADQALFSLSSGGVLTFTSGRDFEVPTDSDANNQYIVQVQVSDGTNTQSQTITVTVTDVAESANRFVAMGSGGTRSSWSSDNGATWVDGSGLASQTYTDVCYGDGIFVAVSFDGTNRVATSVNGKAWTERSAAEANQWNGVCYSPDLDLFCAVSGNGTNRVMTSPDGITWTARSASQANAWNSVCWSPELDLFVAVSQGGTNRVMTSPDGINWTNRTHVGTATYYDVCWSAEKSLFVAVARGGTVAMTSPDGINWTSRTVPANNWVSVCYDNSLDLFVACADGGSNGLVMTSPDGTTWTARTVETGNSYSGIASDNAGHLVIVGAAKSQKSTSGTSWDASVTTQTGLGAVSVAYGANVPA
jgi:hypothetical protein